jgi:hypothetical protein
MRNAKFVESIDNTSGEYTCNECGKPLVSVTRYQSPKGLKTEVRGRCPDAACLGHRTEQLVEG